MTAVSRRWHRGWVARIPTHEDGELYVAKPRSEVPLVTRFQAFCHGCPWSGDITAYEPLAREQARKHTNERGSDGDGQG